ncbi:facilitated trehalose transporter Tret1-like [Ostrinia nubilalis]|uniref:facilitated trehalose transporter Tret1-like n=1 Tax=Ostrinia nubilalis TaxID=29057 RepID=UPI0030824FDA
MSKYGRQYLICFFAYIGQIIFGYAGGWPAPIFSKLHDPGQFPVPPSDMEYNWVISSLYVGAVVGALALSRLSNVIGRKSFLIIGDVGIILSYVGLILIKHILALWILRFIMGMSIAFIYCVNLVYIGEIASTEIRGKLLGSFMIYFSFGFLLVYIVGGYASYDFVNYFALAMSVMYLGGLYFAPESPIYHLLKGRNEEARATLIALNRKEDAENLTELKLQIENNKGTLEWKTLFMVKCNRKALIITGLLYGFQQLSGVPILRNYATTIFDIAESSVAPHVAMIIIGSVQFISAFITIMAVENCGRRILLLMSTSCCCLSMLVLALYFYLYDNGVEFVSNIKWVPLVASVTFLAAFTPGFGVIPGTLVGEMFEVDVRNKGTAIVLAFSWFMSIFTITSFGVIITNMGMYVAFATFSVVAACAFLCTLFLVPETKGKTLIEVQKMLSNSSSSSSSSSQP